MKKKALAFALSLALCFGAALPTFAAVPTSPQEAEKVTHSYEAYQIFTGKEEQGKLVEVEWGSAAKDDTALQGDLWDQFVLDAAKIGEVKDKNGKVIEITAENKGKASASDYAYIIEKYATSVKLQDSTLTQANAEDLAAIISGHIDGKAKFNVQGKTQIEGVSTPGWYLIVDTTEDLVKVGDNDWSVYKDRPQLQMTWDGNIEVKDKHTKIYVDKKVADRCDSATVSYDEWAEDADYDFGDAVPFQVTGNIPDDYASYESFEYIFEDVASDGLLFYEKDPSEFKYTVSIVNGTNKTDITSEADVHNITNKHNFEIGFSNIKSIASKDLITKDSKIVLEYKAILTGENVIYGNPGNPNECRIKFENNVHGGGYTPWDIAIVFSFNPTILKVDSELKALVGAEFKLFKWEASDDNGNGSWVEKYYWENKDGAEEISTFAINGIDDGFYYIEEFKAPKGFNKVDNIYFEVEATHTGKKLTALTVYETDANKARKKDANGNVIVFGSSTSGGSWPIDINPNEEGKQHVPVIETTIINQEGVVLPSTGGIGTTIFYVVGGVLVVGAVVLLIVRRKMRTEEE